MVAPSTIATIVAPTMPATDPVTRVPDRRAEHDEHRDDDEHEEEASSAGWRRSGRGMTWRRPLGRPTVTRATDANRPEPADRSAEGDDRRDAAASGSASKKSRLVNPNGPATTFPGNVWIAVLNSRTEEL